MNNQFEGRMDWHVPYGTSWWYYGDQAVECAPAFRIHITDQSAGYISISKGVLSYVCTERRKIRIYLLLSTAMYFRFSVDSCAG